MITCNLLAQSHANPETPSATPPNLPNTHEPNGSPIPPISSPTATFRPEGSAPHPNAGDPEGPNGDPDPSDDGPDNGPDNGPDRDDDDQ